VFEVCAAIGSGGEQGGARDVPEGGGGSQCGGAPPRSPSSPVVTPSGTVLVAVAGMRVQRRRYMNVIFPVGGDMFVLVERYSRY